MGLLISKGKLVALFMTEVVESWPKSAPTAPNTVKPKKHASRLTGSGGTTHQSCHRCFEQRRDRAAFHPWIVVGFIALPWIL
jgi:hypothetical protein